MINILNANIISEDDVTGQYHAFGPTPDPIGVMPAGCTVCSTSCMGNCSGDCTGGCGDANCEGQCSLTCDSSCSADCTNTCMETCSGGCNLECVNGCRESCTSGCSGACQGCTGCSGSCIDACVNGCKHSCMNVNTTSGTHAIVPKWPSTEQIEDEDIAELLNVIKSYLNVLMQYDYKRISELDEAVVLHDADRFVGQIIVDGSPEDVGEINLADLNLVISDFDGRTVRITAASLVEFIRANYKNYWVWTPVIEEDEYGNKTTITWNFHSSFDETTPEPIYLADLVSGGIGTVTPEHPGLMPSELFIKLDGKDFIYFQALTGNNTTGEAAPAGTTLIRLAANFNGNTDAINVFNTELLGDLDARYAPAGTYVTEVSLNQYKAFVAETYATNAAFTSYQTSVSETYETIANASATYATIVNFNALTNRVATTEANIATLNTNLSNIYTKTQADAKFVERGENARTQVPARVATVVGGTEGKAGLMLPGDIDSINSAIDTAQAASTAVTGLTSRVTANERAIADLVVGQAYATTDYQEGTVTPGTVRIPVTSSVVVGEYGAIDIKKYTVTNLIKNSTFVNGFATNWASTSNIDETISNVEMDSTLNVTVATLAFVPDGVISQSFYSDVRDGINISITFKRHASADKIIEVKLDTETYVSHTITHGIGYYVAEFHFDVEDRNYLSSHTLYIHNPDTSNTVSYEIVNIMVQEGRKYTGWNTNPYDAVNNSVNIVTYSNQIKFQDLPEKYTEDVYDQDQVTLLHRAGDYIDPSSSVIMHKNSTYFFIHLTEANTVDGAIRNDAIPLRIDLDTGVCDISGNAVTAGTLRDTVDPSITLNVPVAQMNEFFAGTSTSFVKDLNMYNSTDTSVPVANRQWPKVELTFKRATSGLSSVDLATTPLVGAFDSNTNKNGEVFNDYENNEATGDYSHASGQNTIATANASTVIGKYNVADGTGANDPKHLFIIGNGTADNDRSNIVEISDDTLNVNGNITKNNNPIPEFVELTQAQYNALSNPDPDITYLITDYDASGGGSGGGGSGYSREIIYENTDFTPASGSSNVTRYATMTKSIANYDELQVWAWMYVDNTKEQLLCATVPVDIAKIKTTATGIDEDVPFLLNASLPTVNRRIWFGFTDDTHVTFVSNRTESGVDSIPYRIYGIKYGSGGGSSGGGGEPFGRTLLYDSGSYIDGAPYQTDVDLSDNLSNYDSIICVVGNPQDNGSANGYQCDTFIADVTDALDPDTDSIHYAGYKERWCAVKFTDTTFNQTARGVVSESSNFNPQIYKIYGYKYGSGGGGGTPTGLGDLAYKDTASGTAVTNVEYDENTHRITITLGTVTVS